MKFFNTKTAMVVAGVVAGGAVLYFLARQAAAKAGDTVDSIGAGLDPTNPDNVVNRGVGAVGDALTGSQEGSFSLGGAIYDLFNPAYDPNADVPQGETLEKIQFTDLRRRRGAVTSPSSDNDTLMHETY